MSERFANAWALLPGYLSEHVVLSAAALALGLLASLGLIIAAVRSERVRWPVLAFASLIQTVPSLALLALFYPLLLAVSGATENVDVQYNYEFMPDNAAKARLDSASVSIPYGRFQPLGTWAMFAYPWLNPQNVPYDRRRTNQFDRSRSFATTSRFDRSTPSAPIARRPASRSPASHRRSATTSRRMMPRQPHRPSSSVIARG